MIKFLMCLCIPLIAFHSYSQDLRFSLQGRVTEQNSKKDVPGANVRLVGSDNSVIEIKTNFNGIYFFDSTKIKSNTTYVVSASGLEVKTNDFPNGLLGNPKAKFTTIGLTEPKNFVQDLVLKKMSITPYIPLILFEKNSYKIRKEYRDSLNIIYRLMTENPNIIIGVAGNSSYDEKNKDSLSAYRAKGVIEYLTAKGIERERLILLFNSDTKPYIKWSGDTKADTLSEKWIENHSTSAKEKETLTRLNSRITFTIERKDYVSKKEEIIISYPCEMLQQVFELPEFQKKFYLCKYPGEEISLVDVKQHFQTCSFSSVCGRNIQAYKYSRDSVDRTKRNVFLLGISRNKRVYTLNFVQPPVGSPHRNYPLEGNTITVKLKFRNKKITVVNMSQGAF